jgi:hypothetical protein
MPITAAAMMLTAHPTDMHGTVRDQGKTHPHALLLMLIPSSPSFPAAGLPAEHMVLLHGGRELQDQQELLHDCQLARYSFSDEVRSGWPQRD